jgi:tetrapyrrole methylase family protein/MazG family protein
MNDVTIVGLGPGDPELLTREAEFVLDAANEVYVLNHRHPVVRNRSERNTFASLDATTTGVISPNGDEARARLILDLAARPQGVVYAVSGNPLIGNPSVQRILGLAAGEGKRVRIVGGLSRLDVTLQILCLDPITTGLQLVDGARLVDSARNRSGATQGDPFAGVYRPLEPTRPVLVCGIKTTVELAGALRTLDEYYRPEHHVSIVRFDHESSAGSSETIPIGSIGGEVWSGDEAYLYLPPIERLADVASFDTLRYVVGRLRAPDGCPWDREQSYATIKKHLIEETYEAVAALDANDYPRFAEELGDVLLQAVMYAQLGREAEDFTMEDILRSVNEKLVRRHPHVFGDLQVIDSADVLRNWERIKRAEKGAPASRFGGVPEAAPALMRADAIQSRAARYGWLPSAGALNLQTTLEGDLGGVERAHALGHLLFDVVALARRYHVDPEEALRVATNRFRDGLDRVLDDCQSRGVAFDSLRPEEWHRLLFDGLPHSPSLVLRETAE